MKKPKNEYEVEMDKIALGAIIDFCSYLTTRKQATVFSARHEAGPIVKRIQTFIKKRKLGSVDLTVSNLIFWENQKKYLLEKIQELEKIKFIDGL